MAPSLQRSASLSDFKTMASIGEQKRHHSAPFGIRHVLYACYFYIVTLTFLYDYSILLLTQIRHLVDPYLSIARSTFDSALEFSKNVQYYFTLASKIFRYRMYENVN